MAGTPRSCSRSSSSGSRRAAMRRHGGAWKIAYADFVTAMMAFFLLMWLLGSHHRGRQEGHRRLLRLAAEDGAADRRLGLGRLVARHQGRRPGPDAHHRPGQARRGRGQARHRQPPRAQGRADARRGRAAGGAASSKIEETICTATRSSPALASQIRLDMTRDGLRIQIVDEDKRPMFASGSAVVKPYMRELLREIGSVLADVPNRLTLEGHTDAHALRRRRPRLQQLGTVGRPRQRVAARTASPAAWPTSACCACRAWRRANPFDRTRPGGAANRRISIIVMTRDAEERVFRGGRIVDDPSALIPEFVQRGRSRRDRPAPLPIGVEPAPAGSAASAARRASPRGSDRGRRRQRTSAPVSPAYRDSSPRAAAPPWQGSTNEPNRPWPTTHRTASYPPRNAAWTRRVEKARSRVRATSATSAPSAAASR